MDEQESNVQNENKIHKQHNTKNHKQHNKIGLTLILISFCIFIYGLWFVSGWETVIVITFSGFFFILGALVLAIGNALDYVREDPGQPLLSKRSQLLVAFIVVSFAILWTNMKSIPFIANGNGGFFEVLIIVFVSAILMGEFGLWVFEKISKK